MDQALYLAMLGIYPGLHLLRMYTACHCGAKFLPGNGTDALPLCSSMEFLAPNPLTMEQRAFSPMLEGVLSPLLACQGGFLQQLIL